MSNPITQNVRYLASYFGIWLLFAFIQVGILYFVLTLNPVIALVDAIVFNLFLSFIGLAIWPLVSFSSLEGAQLLNTFITHIAGAAVLIGLCIYVFYNVMGLFFDENETYQTFLQSSLFWRVALAAIMYMLIALNYYVIIYNEEFKSRKMQESELKQSLKTAELEMLKSQLNPHFIFNSLNSISSLTLTNPDKAQEMVISLSEFLRYSIKPNEGKLIPLKVELDAINQFISIEKVRFGDRLMVEIHCADDCKNHLVPPLIIQPLIENAIKYGVHESLAEASVHINCSLVQEALEIKIKNSFDPNSVPARQSGIGLKNVANRLKLLFGTSSLMQVTKQLNIFTVSLIIPQVHT
ncbi:MAG: histidine kinase [Cyclobacteriaceae bacterium]|nr:histidine kinase [Cyclobacteriaceae bacterium]